MKQLLYPLFKIYSLLLKVTMVFILIFTIYISRVDGQTEMDVIGNNWLEYSDAANSLYHYLSEQAFRLLEQRARNNSDIRSLVSWQARQKYIRETLADIVGPFPNRSPLNSKIIRTINKGDYRIEHIIFESQPGFHVTSSIFIPEGIKKGTRVPAIIYCSGHSADGYRNAVYQHVILNLVNKGFIVFAFDPVGQGERLEYFDPETGESFIGGPTKEHSYPGAQALLTGNSQARFMIWDGIRAVDYLLTRKEVDPARIGITGRSGGGTQSAYIAAMDDRIYAAAPENYITNYKRLLQSIGPQDAEQNLTNLIKRGLDHPDFIIARAPKPYMMITTTGDMFSIQGAIETEKEVSAAYKAYGKEKNFSRVEDDAGHASTQRNREAMYAFFQMHLGNPGSPADEETELLEKSELQVTKTGQISTSLKGETVFSINRKAAIYLDSILKSRRNDSERYFPDVIKAAKRLSGYQEPSSIEAPVFTGRINRDGYNIEKYILKGEGDYIIPFLLFKPDRPGNNALIYLHPAGKKAEANPGGEIERFVNAGITVLAPDLLGTGEMGPGLLRGDAFFDGVSHNIWYASMLIGRSITGIRTGDIIRLIRWLKLENEEYRLGGLARREMTQDLLHAAVFSSELESVTLIDPYSSYMSIVKNRIYYSPLILGTVPGALKEYDLPDLAAALAPRKLLIAGMTDGSVISSDTESINKDLEIVKKGYLQCQAIENLSILPGDSSKDIFDILLTWLK